MHTGSQTSTLDTSSNAGFQISDSSTPQLPHLVVPSQATVGSSKQEEEQQQQQQRSERLPRCSTVSLQTELATPALVVFSGGTAFNSIAGTVCDTNPTSSNTLLHSQQLCLGNVYHVRIQPHKRSSLWVSRGRLPVGTQT